MREIIFRGKRKDNGEWIYGDLVCGDMICSQIEDVEDALGTYCGQTPYVGFVDVVGDTVGQFTGFTDMNGNKIFEGDIIQSRYNRSYLDKTYVVKFINDRGGWFPFANGDGCGCCEEDTYPPSDDGSVDYYVVIGNIHNNPEILGGNE